MEGRPPDETKDLWEGFMKRMQRQFERLPAAERNPELAPTQATARVLIYFKNDGAREEAIEIDGVKLGLMRRPERFTSGDLQELRRFASKDLIAVNTNTFFNLLDHLHKLDADNITNMIKNLLSKITHVKVDNVQEVPAGSGQALAEQAVRSSGMLSHPYISTRIVADATGPFGLKFESPSAVLTDRGDCLVRCILDTFKESYDKCHAKPLTHADFDAFLPAKDLSANYSCSVQDVVPFFRKYRLCLTAMDVRGRVILRYTPESEGKTRNSKVRPAHCYVVIHNGHAYRLDQNVDSLSHKLAGREEAATDADSEATDETSEPAEESLRASSKYPKVNVKPNSYVLVNSFEELMDFLRETSVAGAAVAAPQTFHIHYNDDLEAAFFRLRDLYGVEASVRVTGESVTGITLFTQHTYQISDFPIRSRGEGRTSIDPAYYDVFMSWMQRLLGACLNPAYKSQYGPSLVKAWASYGKAQLHRRLIPEAPDEAETVDVVRAYTANLLDIKQVPVFDYLDEFRPWGGDSDSDGTIEDWTLYEVENLDPSNNMETWFVADRKFTLVSGYVLKRAALPAGSYRILSYIRPSRMLPNLLANVVRELYASADLPDSLKKFAVNVAIGLCNKKYNRNELGVYTTDRDEAQHFSSHVAMMKPGHFLAVQKSSKVSLTEGYLPIGFLVYDIMRLRMLRHWRTLRAAGSQVYAIATDALFVDKVPTGLDYRATKTLQDLGQLHVEGKKATPLKLWEVKLNERAIEPFVPTVTEVSPLEFMLKGGEGGGAPAASLPPTLVTGVLPGSGKTHLLATQLDKGTTLFLCSNNLQTERLQAAYGHEALTLCKFLGFRVGNEGTLEGGGGFTVGSKKGLKSIVLDELYQHSIQLLGSFFRWYESKPRGISLYATGDIDQTSSCEFYNNIPDRVAYMEVLARWLPTRVVLQGSRRLVEPSQTETLLAIRTDLFGDDAATALSPKDVVRKYGLRSFESVDELTGPLPCVTLSNATAHILNAKFEGGALRVGSQVACKAYHKELTVNKVYTVTAVHEKTVELEGMGSKRFVKSMFRPAFCWTGHSLQGSTLAGSYAVFDLDSPHATREWFWVALSRARDLRDPMFYVGPSLSKDFHAHLNRKLAGHRAYDKANGYKTDVDAAWVHRKLKSQNFCCAVCHGMMDISDPSDSLFWSIDRLDNFQGHTVDNCQLTHVRCNTSTH